MYILFNITQDGSVHLPLCVILSVTQDSVHLPLSVIFRLIYEKVGISVLHSASYTMTVFVSLCDVQHYPRQQCVHSSLIQYHTTARWQCLHLQVMFNIIQDGSVTVSLSSSVST